MGIFLVDYNEYHKGMVDFSKARHRKTFRKASKMGSLLRNHLKIYQLLTVFIVLAKRILFSYS